MISQHNAFTGIHRLDTTDILTIESVTDYIIIKQYRRFKWRDARVNRGTECGLDYHVRRHTQKELIQEDFLMVHRKSYFFNIHWLADSKILLIEVQMKCTQS